jgi:hypothetical protein
MGLLPLFLCTLASGAAGLFVGLRLGMTRTASIQLAHSVLVRLAEEFEGMEARSPGAALLASEAAAIVRAMSDAVVQ